MYLHPDLYQPSFGNSGLNLPKLKTIYDYKPSEDITFAQLIRWNNHYLYSRYPHDLLHMHKIHNQNIILLLIQKKYKDVVGYNWVQFVDYIRQYLPVIDSGNKSLEYLLDQYPSCSVKEAKSQFIQANIKHLPKILGPDVSKGVNYVVKNKIQKLRTLSREIRKYYINRPRFIFGFQKDTKELLHKIKIYDKKWNARFAGKLVRSKFDFTTVF